MVKAYPEHPCLGTRVGDDYKWITYSQTYEKVKHFSHGLLSQNLTPRFEDGSRAIGIYAINQEGWTVANFASQRIDCTIVTLYSTLGQEALVFCINQTEIQSVVCDSKPLDLILDLKIDFKIPLLKNAITLFEPSQE